jgi:glycogen debranching enzyme
MGQHHSIDPKEVWRFGLSHLNQLRQEYGFAASDTATGIYATLFGRDSLWMLIFLLKAVRLVQLPEFKGWVEEAAGNVFDSLRNLQGKVHYDLIEEQPGKIIHEYRGKIDVRLEEMEIPFANGRSYSGFDQTFLFIVAYREFVVTYPDHPLSDRIWPSVQKAISWMEEETDPDQDGLFEYRRRNESNILNQVWRDSFDSISKTGVDAPKHPIAWLSVQAYGYRALVDAAALYEQRGKQREANDLLTRAKQLEQKVQRLFWLEHEQCLAIAVDAEKAPIPMISSDVGHALWSGLVGKTDRRLLVHRMMKRDMMTDYGLRTLSSGSALFAPFSYHRGNIWPFDNAVFTLALFENGYPKEAEMVAESVWSAIEALGTPVELYVAIEKELIRQPDLASPYALLLRKVKPENTNQGFTAAGLVLMAVILANLKKIKIEDVSFIRRRTHGSGPTIDADC